MRFLRRHQFLLCFLAVLVFCCVMVLRQYLANQTAHVQRREDFLLLHERGQNKACHRLYGRLIQELPGLSERSLVEDLQRTALLVDPKSPDHDDLVWKYYVSVRKELELRAEPRLARALDEANKE